MKTVVTAAAIVAFWLLCAVCSYRITDEKDDIGPVGNIILSALFGWMIVPIAAAYFAVRAGAYYSDELKRWNRMRKVKPVLRPGMENGLYE